MTFDGEVHQQKEGLGSLSNEDIAKKLGYSVLRRCRFFVAPTELLKNPWRASPCIGGNKPTHWACWVSDCDFCSFQWLICKRGINWHFFGTPWSKSMWVLRSNLETQGTASLGHFLTTGGFVSISHWRTSPWCSRYIKISDVCGHSHDRSEDLNGSTQVLSSCLSHFVPGFWCCNS